MERFAILGWGSCPCGGRYEHRHVEVAMTVHDEAIALLDVPQGVCPLCGSRVYKAEMLARIETIMKDTPVARPSG